MRLSLTFPLISCHVTTKFSQGQRLKESEASLDEPAERTTLRSRGNMENKKPSPGGEGIHQGASTSSVIRS
jgi:hypothetical protein